MIEESSEHPLNEYSPILWTEEGIAILVNEVQPWNAWSSIIWIDSGILICCNEVQL